MLNYDILSSWFTWLKSLMTLTIKMLGPRGSRVDMEPVGGGGGEEGKCLIRALSQEREGDPRWPEGHQLLEPEEPEEQ